MWEKVEAEEDNEEQEERMHEGEKLDCGLRNIGIFLECKQFQALEMSTKELGQQK